MSKTKKPKITLGELATEFGIPVETAGWVLFLVVGNQLSVEGAKNVLVLDGGRLASDWKQCPDTRLTSSGAKLMRRILTETTARGEAYTEALYYLLEKGAPPYGSVVVLASLDIAVRADQREKDATLVESRATGPQVLRLAADVRNGVKP